MLLIQATEARRLRQHFIRMLGFSASRAYSISNLVEQLNDEERKLQKTITTTVRNHGFAEWCSPKPNEWCTACLLIVIGSMIVVASRFAPGFDTFNYMQYVSLTCNLATALGVAIFSYRIVGRGASFFKIGPDPVYEPDRRFTELVSSLLDLKKVPE